MTKYIIKRLLLVIPMVLGVAIIVFSIINAIPGDPGRRMLGPMATQEQVDMLNEQFGRQMASCVDIAILVGKSHVDPIEHGLLSNGFDKSCVVRVATLDEATEKLPLFTENGCVVLFENDLSDNYNE